MKVIKVDLQNFGSYVNLNLNVSNQGLTLIYGSTGSGKSTLMDAILWTIFGTTAKDGAADDVRPWQNIQNTTVGTVTVDSSDEIIIITRKRGQGKNELYYQIGTDGVQHRGKDIPETQKFLEERLRVNASLYQTAAYYHELSPSASFFQSSAKIRRELFERIVDLSLCVRLSARLTVRLSQLKKSIDETKIKISRKHGSLEQLERQLETANRRRDSFLQEHFRDRQINKNKKEEFEKEKNQSLLQLNAKIANLEFKIDPNVKEICGECGQYVSTHNTDLRYEIDQVQRQLERVEASEFVSIPIPDHNLYDDTVKNLSSQLKTEEEGLKKINQVEEDLAYAIVDAKKLQDLVVELRSELMRRAVNQMQDTTNGYLTKYFDGVFRVEFTSEGDNIGVKITKDGNECSYNQLSKGQRQILKLCFAVSVMESSANNTGIHFSELFFDEPTDGCDTEFKLKAFNLFQELANTHDSVYVIEHNEAFKSLFSNQIEVAMVNGYSELL